LPISVDGSKTTAQLKNGVLTVTISPVEADQPKEIKVTA
ncbi:MAG TPA: Hsp20/alpha crystallin family protein, partial [Lentisphaeria bacterium]|nr:Hsp20/alpha crystallin family protein [Lentisphaeria bacterium]